MRGDGVRGAAEHDLGFVADGQDLVVRHRDGDHRGLVDHHPLAVDMDEGVRGPEIDGNAMVEHGL